MSSRLDQLWAGWRSSYLAAVSGDRTPLDPDATGSLFERILRLPDDEGYVVHRGTTCSALLNAYPYSNGHLMVLPNRAVADLEGLTDAEHDELWRLVRAGVAALRAGYSCGGVNVGLNLGDAAGAGVPDHLHVHLVPRWPGDTNFMTVTANTRVLPASLAETWHIVRAAWPR